MALSPFRRMIEMLWLLFMTAEVLSSRCEVGVEQATKMSICSRFVYGSDVLKTEAEVDCLMGVEVGVMIGCMAHEDGSEAVADDAIESARAAACPPTSAAAASVKQSACEHGFAAAVKEVLGSKVLAQLAKMEQDPAVSPLLIKKRAPALVIKDSTIDNAAAEVAFDGSADVRLEPAYLARHELLRMVVEGSAHQGAAGETVLYSPGKAAPSATEFRSVNLRLASPAEEVERALQHYGYASMRLCMWIIAEPALLPPEAVAAGKWKLSSVGPFCFDPPVEDASGTSPTSRLLAQPFAFEELALGKHSVYAALAARGSNTVVEVGHPCRFL
jgi:hypothetical protein